MDLKELPISIGEMDALIEQLEEDNYIIIEDEKTIEYLLKKNVIFDNGDNEFTQECDFYSFRAEFISEIFKDK